MGENTKKLITIAIILFIFICIVAIEFTSNVTSINHLIKAKSNEFRLISSSENSDLENILKDFANKNDINLTIDYAGTIDIAKESERAIVDIETLQKTNEDIIDTLNELIEIHENGSKARKEAEVELQNIESRLKEKLLEVKSNN